MTRRKWAAVAAFIVVAAGAGTAAFEITGDNEIPITGPALQKATSAALAATGGGRVTGTEVGDEEAYYQVEVTLSDGSQVDVQLNKQFQVVSRNSDSDKSNGD